jgi:hypothetical protein
MKRRRFAIVVDDQLVGVVEAHGNSQAADGLGRGVDLIPLKQLRVSTRLRPLFYQALSLLADRPPVTDSIIDDVDKFDRTYYPALEVKPCANSLPVSDSCSVPEPIKMAMQLA